MSIDKVLDFAKFFSHNNIQCKNLNGFHNQIYLINGDINFILRISSSLHRNKDETLSEIDFLKYLGEKGVSLSQPIEGLDGEYVYEINEDNEKWIVSAYQIAKGNDFRTRGIDDEVRMIEVGRMLGKIHKYSKQYKPQNICQRRNWNDGQHIAKAGHIFEKDYPRLKVKFDEFIQKMNKLPKDNNDYGLIHGDFLFSNYFFDGNKITIFDFDECEYSWFIYDIAVCIYYYLLGGNPSELGTKTEEAEELLFNLLTGYLKENTIDEWWIKNIDLFFKMREYVLLSTMSEKPYGNLSGWQKSFFDGALDRQLNDRPFIQADFIKVLNRLK